MSCCSNKEEEKYFTSSILVEAENIKHVPRVLEEYIDLISSHFKEEGKDLDNLLIDLRFEAKDIKSPSDNLALTSAFWVAHAIGEI